MRILVTGKNGQLGRSLHKIVNADNAADNSHGHDEFVFVGREELDLECPKNINDYFRKFKFDIIINCAAYTAVDKAEENAGLANRINHLAVKQLAEIAAAHRAKILHISTDYVFDGENDKPYTETDTPNPINVYGKTKLAGEKALKAVMPTNVIVIRTSWVYSEYGNNFVSTMLRLGKERDELNVVSDQIGSPTYATDLAGVILQIVQDQRFREEDQATQIYHYSNEGEISWCEFAKGVFEIKRVDCKVNPIVTEKYPTPAKRPRNTFMSKSKIIKEFSLVVHDWRLSLNKCIEIIDA